MTPAEETPSSVVARLLDETLKNGELDRRLRSLTGRWPQLLDLGDLRELVLARAWERRDQFRGSSSSEFLAWLRRFAWSIAVDLWRDKERRARLIDRVGELLPMFGASVEDQIETQDLFSWLIAGLTERERKVLILKYYENMSLEAVAQVMNTTCPAISQLHYRAILKLRERMKKAGA